MNSVIFITLDRNRSEAAVAEAVADASEKLLHKPKSLAIERSE